MVFPREIGRGVRCFKQAPATRSKAPPPHSPRRKAASIVPRLCGGAASVRPIASLAGRVLHRRKLRPSHAVPRFRVNNLRAAVCASKRLELTGTVRLFRPFRCSPFLQQLLHGWTSEAMLRSCALDLNRLALLLGNLKIGRGVRCFKY